MKLLQLTSGKGPIECARAVALAFSKIQQDCKRLAVLLDVIDQQSGPSCGTTQSFVIALEGNQEAKIVDNWCGNFLWICQSPYRPRHKRKNWYFSGYELQVSASKDFNPSDVSYSTCRASGAGGQHVNTTDSAVRAVHTISGLSVRVETGRSQHANKKLAILLLAHQFSEQKELEKFKDNQVLWQSHQKVERGNPSRVFQGAKFLEL
ncbi:peptide chain release factor H [Endozoicomonas atrinae]|uniref:peptide chain release factor H n=1 Tax=Endozoicomonas atrinae TaxID=1333660 RepID=UPI003B004E63